MPKRVFEFVYHACHCIGILSWLHGPFGCKMLQVWNRGIPVRMEELPRLQRMLGEESPGEVGVCVCVSHFVRIFRWGLGGVRPLGPFPRVHVCLIGNIFGSFQKIKRFFCVLIARRVSTRKAQKPLKVLMPPEAFRSLSHGSTTKDAGVGLCRRDLTCRRGFRS